MSPSFTSLVEERGLTYFEAEIDAICEANTSPNRYYKDDSISND